MSWLSKVSIFSIIILWFVVLDDNSKSFISASVTTIVKNITLGNDLSQYECSDVVDMAKVREFRSPTMGKFKIVSAKDLKLISKNNNKIICSGNFYISGGGDDELTAPMKLSATKNSNDDIFDPFVFEIDFDY